VIEHLPSKHEALSSNPHTRKKRQRLRRSWFKIHPWLLVIPATVRSINRRIRVHTGLGKKQNPISKVPRAKRARPRAQVVGHLPCKCEVLSSNSSTAKKNGEEEMGRVYIGLGLSTYKNFWLCT
jgi:hypothetical protein